jgi:hypothetical protein
VEYDRDVQRIDLQLAKPFDEGSVEGALRVGGAPRKGGDLDQRVAG